MDTSILPQNTKECTLCHSVLPATDEYFTRDKRGKYGFVARCKKCVSRLGCEYAKTEARKATLKKYKQSQKGKEAIKRYKQGESGKAAAKRRWLSDKHKEYARRWKKTNEKHKQFHRERQREYRASDKGIAFRTTYFKSDRFKELSRRYWESERGKLIRKAINSKYRTDKIGAGGCFTPEEFISLCEYYDNKCLCCGSAEVKLTADHVVPVSCGGSSNIDNIQPLCRSCNSSKLDRTIDYRNKGLPLSLRGSAASGAE